jgi:hypothetical protein
VADNVPITSGSGTDIATDQVTTTGEHVQLFKLAESADGSRVLIPADATDGLSVKVTNANVPIGDGTNVITVDIDPADNEPNSGNAIHVEGRTYVYNGSTWDRVRGDISNGLDVDVTRLPALAAGTNMIGKVDISDGVNDAVIDVSGSDAESATTASLVTNARLKAFNGTTWDRVRSHAVTFKGSQYTAAQTGTALWTPAAGRAVVITSIQIQSGGTTAGTCVLWFGASGDTAYNRGTDAAVFDGEFAPTATNKPGVIMSFPTPIRGTTDYLLRVTTTNAQTVTFTVWGYEI